MQVSRLVYAFILTATLCCSACQNPHFFPRLRPLFAGLDESRVPAAARSALAEAKVDFQLARHGAAPRYARFVSEARYSHTRCFQGRGYRLTMVNEGLVVSSRTGPAITIDSSITGGKPYRYDEIDEISD